MPEQQGLRRVVLTEETPEEHQRRLDNEDLRLTVLVRSVVADTVKEALSEKLPTEEERQWIRLAMQREARRERVHQAVVEKSLAGLLWAAIVGVGLLVADYAKNHGWKP